MLPDPSIMSHLMKTYMPDTAARPKPRKRWAVRLSVGMNAAISAAARLRAHIARRRSDTALEAEIERLASLSPHLLPDIGLDPHSRELVAPEPLPLAETPMPAPSPAPVRQRAGRLRAQAAVQALPAARNAPAA